MVMPEETGIQVGPAWSPDGTRLMYAGTSSDAADARGGIWETTAEGSEPRLISTDCKPPTCVEEIDPSLSADGTLLAFIRQVGTETDAATSFVVAIRDLTTGAVTELEATRQPAGLVMHRHPRWSPDGVRIVFHSLTFGTGSRQEDSDIFVINVDGTGLRQVSPDSIVAGDADWSPDGTTIVFTSKPIHEWGYHDFGERHIYTMAPDGSNLRRLDPNGWWGAPSWTPDGTRILFTEGSRPQGLDVHNIMVMDRDGSNVQTIATFADCCRWYAVQQPSPN
jgi:TolB protein